MRRDVDMNRVVVFGGSEERNTCHDLGLFSQS